MISQIQPHFLFNTLTTIRALCRSDPQKAEQVTTLFSNYLRQNLDSLETQEMIPLEKELEHVKIYAEIEMTRFPNIRVEYDIRERRRAKCSVRRTTPSSWNRKIKSGTEGRKRAFPPFLFSESLPSPGRDAYLPMTQDRTRTGGSLRKRTKSKILKGENKQ